MLWEAMKTPPERLPSGWVGEEAGYGEEAIENKEKGIRGGGSEDEKGARGGQDREAGEEMLREEEG